MFASHISGPLVNLSIRTGMEEPARTSTGGHRIQPAGVTGKRG